MILSSVTMTTLMLLGLMLFRSPLIVIPLHTRAIQPQLLCVLTHERAVAIPEDAHRRVELHGFLRIRVGVSLNSSTTTVVAIGNMKAD